MPIPFSQSVLDGRRIGRDRVPLMAPGRRPYGEQHGGEEMSTIASGILWVARSVVTTAPTAPRARKAGRAGDHPNRQAIATSMPAPRMQVAAVRAGVSIPGSTFSVFTMTAVPGEVRGRPGIGGREGAIEASGGVVHVDVEIGQATLQELPGGGDGIEAAVGGVEGHEPAVWLLGVAVQVDGTLQGGDRCVGATGVVFELGEAEVGIERSVMEVLADRFDPWVADALEQVAAVEVDRPTQRGTGGLVGVSLGGGGR